MLKQCIWVVGYLIDIHFLVLILISGKVNETNINNTNF
jgi:hypothetical protein